MFQIYIIIQAVFTLFFLLDVIYSYVLLISEYLLTNLY